MNRFNLPDVNFFEKAPEDIERDILFHIGEQTGFQLSNADPRRKFVQAMVLYIVQERNNLDYSLKQNLLAYAEDEYLDHHGVPVATPRLGDKPALTTMEFVLEEDRVDILVIEEGTRFIVGDDTFFATEATVTVPVGTHTIQVSAKCLETGIKGNGYLPGEITNLVDPISWVKEVRNITLTSGGVEVEENDAYAERIRIAPESFSVAGPESAYIYWAKSVSQQIVDVIVLSPEAGTIDIRILVTNGELPSLELLNQVRDVFSTNKNIRPITDHVVVNSPEQVLYDADVEYWIQTRNESVLISLQKQVEEAFQQYLIWQKEKMGRDVDLSELITRLKNAGAYRVRVNSPMFLSIDKFQVSKENVANLTFVGLTDE